MNEYERAILGSVANRLRNGFPVDAAQELDDLVAASERCLWVRRRDGGPRSILAELRQSFPQQDFDASTSPQGGVLVTWEYGPSVDDVRRAIKTA